MKAKIVAILTAAVIAQTMLSGAVVPAAEVQTSIAATSEAPASEVSNVEAPAAENSAAAVQSTVTVTGRASVYSIPDKAILTLRVQTSDKSAKEAQTQNSTSSAAVVDALKESGIDENSIRTTNYNLYPQYDYTLYGDENESSIVGYTCSSQIEVKDLDAGAVGDIISLSLEAGANGIDSIEFKCSDYDDRYDEALTAAVKAARHTAEVIAAAAGQTAGNAISIEEGYHSTVSQYKSMDYMDEAASEDADFGSSFVLTPGESEIEASVTVTYALSQCLRQGQLNFHKSA